MSKSATDWIKLMLSTGEYADVHFLVGDGDAKELVPAHKLILKKASDVFEAMFRFDSKNAKAENASANCPVVDMPDVEPAAFKLMLSFIYADDLNELNGDNAMAVLYAAENWRQMLGPALYKIRFPLVQKMEFSEKIVPFGVLTAEEVTSIEKYHSPPDFRGISNGILYPLQFSCHGRISPHGTIVMCIKKVSEFVREAVKSQRYSKTVQIMGFGWRIMAEIRINIKTKEKFLGFCLCSMVPEEDSCLCSATFRIVTQNAEAENCIGKFNDVIFNNKPNRRGFVNFIALTELMDQGKGFYNKREDKMTLAIDLIVKNAKVAKFTHDPCKSNGTISMEIEKVSEFAREVISSERESETVHIKGFLWKISAEIKTKNGSTEKWLGIYLLCNNASNEDKNWSCKCSANLRIVSQKCGVTDIRREFDDKIFDNKEDSWGYSDFISFVQLMDPSKGFYKQNEDKVTLAVDLIVKKAKTLKIKTIQQFAQ
ncbi:hypothetical protein niasHT_003365 [Heterodera trifolii]|uniref:BTB domain-containing protein n=1 Tax=Heterodera trifolii TaxID=157864 RepID=A0ABD2LNM3_9BILA